MEAPGQASVTINKMRIIERDIRKIGEKKIEATLRSGGKRETLIKM